jgi:hypothetical protein
MFYTSKYVTEAVCHSVAGVLLIFALSLAMGGQRAGRRGVPGCDRAEEPMNIQTYQKSIKEEWFSCTTAFVALAVPSPVVFPTSFADSLSARAILLCNYFGLVESHKKCQCSRTVSLVCRKRSDAEDFRFLRECSAGGHKAGHMQEGVKGIGIFEKIPVASWFPMLHMILMLKRSDRLVNIEKEIEEAYGICHRTTLREWRHMYQDALYFALDMCNGLQIGGKGEVVVFDETLVGLHKGIHSGADRTRTTSRSESAVKKRILKKLPGRTIWRGARKRPAAASAVMRRPAAASAVMRRPAAASTVMRRPAAHVMKRPAGVAGTFRDPRRNGRWIWLAVTVGKGSQVYTHENGLKRVTFEILPQKEDAPSKKPRGVASMATVVHKHVKKGSFLIFDGWKASKKAVEDLGYRHAPPVNHSVGYRDQSTGFHSNDIESENARLKTWLRTRYTKLRIDIADVGPQSATQEENRGAYSRDLHEYCYYVNIGNTFTMAMKGVAAAAGGSVTAFSF